jgi:hypothetical protein
LVGNVVGNIAGELAGAAASRVVRKFQIGHALSNLSPDVRANLLAARADLGLNDELFHTYLSQTRHADLGQMSLEQGLRVWHLARQSDVDIYITGRWANTNAELAIRRRTADEAIALAKARSIDAMDEADRRFGKTAYEALQAEVGEKYGLDFFQVKRVTGGSEIDYFVKYRQWADLPSLEQRGLARSLKDTFGVVKADNYVKYSGANIPPGAIKFGADGTITKFSLASPYSGRPENIKAIRRYIRALQEGAPTGGPDAPHTLYKHAPNVRDSYLKSRLSAPENLPFAARFDTWADLNRGIQGTIGHYKDAINYYAYTGNRRLEMQGVDMVGYYGYVGGIQNPTQDVSTTTVRLRSNGMGSWYLFTAFPRR